MRLCGFYSFETKEGYLLLASKFANSRIDCQLIVIIDAILEAKLGKLVARRIFDSSRRKDTWTNRSS